MINPYTRNLPSIGRPDDFEGDVDFLIADLPAKIAQFNAAIVALNQNDVIDTSVTSNTVGLGPKNFTVSLNKSFQPGMFLMFSDGSAPSTNSMAGQVTSYNSATGALAVNMLWFAGSGTKTSWNISPTAPISIPSSRNYVLNSDFVINQRGASNTTVTAGKYLRDRWYANTGGATYSIGGAHHITITAGEVQQTVYLPPSTTYTMAWDGTATVKVGGVTVTSPCTVTPSGSPSLFYLTLSGGYIDNLRVNRGSAAGPWEKPIYNDSLAQCQVFCFAFSENIGYTQTVGNFAQPNIRMPVPMAGTISFEGTPAFVANAGSAGVPAMYTGTAVPASKNQVFITNSAANWTVGALVQLNAVFVAEYESIFFPQ